MEINAYFRVTTQSTPPISYTIHNPGSHPIYYAGSHLLHNPGSHPIALGGVCDTPTTNAVGLLPDGDQRVFQGNHPVHPADQLHNPQSGQPPNRIG